VTQVKSEKWLTKLTQDERIVAAKSKIEALVDRVIIGSYTRASNKCMQFPAGKPGPSKAALCYNHLMASQYKYESLILASIWDGVGGNRNSIPTVIKLVDDPSIVACLRRAAEDQYEAHYQHFRAEEVRKFDVRWRESLAIQTRVMADPNFGRLKEYRNFELAHSLHDPIVPIDPSQIRLAEPFWDDTISCVSNLQSAITLGGGALSDATERLHTEYAKDFWQNLLYSDSQDN
jgi:hypothetical protein